MIESKYWKSDLLMYAKRFRPLAKPPRWSEKLQVNFEKDVIVSFFMIRKLMEGNKLSSKTTKHKAWIFRSPCVGKVNNRNFMYISDLYDFENEETVSKDVVFLCNQLVHSGAMYAYRGEDRNWGGVYTCSDFERSKYIYRFPLTVIIEILEIAGNDYPTTIKTTFDEKTGDYIVTTN